MDHDMNLEAPNQYWSFQANEVFPAENDQQIVYDYWLTVLRFCSRMNWRKEIELESF